MWADSADQGLQKWLKEILGWDLEGVKHWVDGTALGMGARRSGTAGAGHSCGVPGLATKVGNGTDLWYG
jgi:hypothetical protein